MTDLATLQRRLEGLKRIRAAGTLTVESPEGGRVTYRSDAELVAAIASIETDIGRAQGRHRLRTFRIHTHKGW